jgi:hypothetical protein
LFSSNKRKIKRKEATIISHPDHGAFLGQVVKSINKPDTGHWSSNPTHRWEYIKGKHKTSFLLITEWSGLKGSSPKELGLSPNSIEPVNVTSDSPE